jgi:hypothetical protein
MLPNMNRIQKPTTIPIRIRDPYPRFQKPIKPPEAREGVPLNQCKRCGYKGPHATSGDCIAALRDRLARFE